MIQFLRCVLKVSLDTCPFVSLIISMRLLMTQRDTCLETLLRHISSLWLTFFNEIINDTKGYVSRDTFKTHLIAVAYIFLWGWDVSISLMLISMATTLTHLTLENMPHLIYLCHISYEIHATRGSKILWRVFVAWFLPGYNTKNLTWYIFY